MNPNEIAVEKLREMATAATDEHNRTYSLDSMNRMYVLHDALYHVEAAVAAAQPRVEADRITPRKVWGAIIAGVALGVLLVVVHLHLVP